MDIIELGAIGELVGGVAVIASLIYVGLQVRQNTRSVRTGTFAGIADSFNRFNVTLATDPDLASILDRGRSDREGLPQTDRSRLDFLLLGVFKVIETLYYQSTQGTAEVALWEAVNRSVVYEMSQPGVRAWWRSNPHAFTDAFRAHVEQTLREQDLARP